MQAAQEELEHSLAEPSYPSGLVSPKHADAEASEAYRRTDRSGFVAAAAAGSRELVVVALESCSRRGQQLVAWQQEVGA